MRPRNALLLLGLAATLALTSAEEDTYAVHNGMDAEKPLFGAEESDPSTELGEALQSFLQAGEPEEKVDIVRINVIDEEGSAVARKRACSKALMVIAEQDELLEQADSLLRGFESAFGLDSPEPRSRASCEDLDQAKLVAPCEFVVESKDVVLQLLRQGRTEDQVCDVMSAVSDIKAVDTLSCGLCHRLVQMVTQALTNEVQQVEQVREIIGDVCDVTLADSMCHTFLNKFDDIVEWLRHDTDAVVVCLRLAMCTEDRLSDSETPILDWFLGDEARKFADEAAATREWNSFSDIETLSLGSIFGNEARRSVDEAAVARDTQEARKSSDDATAMRDDTQERNSFSDSESTSNLDWIFGNEARKSVDDALAIRDARERDSVSDSEYKSTLDSIFGNEARKSADDSVAARYTEQGNSVSDSETPGLVWLFSDEAKSVDDTAAARDTQERNSVSGSELLSLDLMFGDDARKNADDTVAARYTERGNIVNDRETLGLGWLFGDEAEERNGASNSEMLSLDLIFGDEARESADDAIAARYSEQGDSVSDSEFTSNIDLIFGVETRRTADEGIATSVFEEQEQSCSFCMSTAGVIAQVSSRFPDQVLMTKDLLKSVCRTASPVSKCQEVEANFDRVAELMQQGLHPREVCGRIDLCAQQVTSDKACVYCDATTTLVEVILQEAPEQINEIRNYADMICDMLGDDSPCHEYVGKLDSVIDSLNKGGHPREICKALKYCSEDFSGESLRADMTRNDPFGRNHRVGMGDGGMYSEMFSHLNAMFLAKRDEHLSHQPSIDYDSCFFCSHVVAVVHHVQLASPEKLPIVKTILSNVCQLVPSKCSCDDVDEKFDDIVKWDKEGKRPHDICKLLGTCAKLQNEEDDMPAIADELKGVVVASQWPAGDESECAYCQFATTVAKIALEQYSADIRQVRAYADMICDMLGEDNPCHTYVKQMDFVIDSISKGMSSKVICVGLEFCPATVANSEGDALAWILDDRLSRATSIDRLPALDSSLKEMLKEPMDTLSDSCFFCMQVAPVLDVAVAQDSSQIEKIGEIADLICGTLPGNNQCHSFVMKIDAVVDSLRKGEQPKSICHNLQLCPMGSGSAMLDLAVPDMMAAQKRTGESTTCAYCSGVVTVLEHTLDEKPEQVNELREVTGYLCQLLPADDTCHSDLKIFDEAVAGLRSGKGPEEICQTLELCTSIEDRDESSGLVDFTGGDFLPTGCATCQQNTLLLASLIERPDSLATFEREISSVCRLIPGSGECELLLKHKDVIIDLLKKKEDVTTICTRIGQCSAVAKEKQDKSMPMGCLFCEFIADLVEHAKDSEKALSEAKATLETVCTILPPQARCDVLSSKFDELLLLMREGKSPSEACHAAALCDAEFVFSPATESDEDPIVRSFEKALRGVGNVMEIE